MVRIITLAIVLCFPMATFAIEPNIQPGNWEYTATMRFLNLPMPEQTQHHTECVTLESIQRGKAFMEDVEGCELRDMDMRRDRMTYTMDCVYPDGTEMKMKATMRFMGEQVEVRMDADVVTPGGPMKMQIIVDGERIGDC